MTKILVIDADSLAYTVAYFHSQQFDEPMESIEGEFTGFDSDDELMERAGWAYHDIKQQIDRWVEINKCDDYQMHLTAGGRLRECYKEMFEREPQENFRYEVARALPDDYKHNRPSETIEGVEDVLRVMAIKFNSILHDRWEADDAVVAMKMYDPESITIAAIDKDVLNQTPGVHFNYRKLEPHVTTEYDAVRYAYWQCLVGDPGDGYKGVPGVGKAKADKLLVPDMTEEQMWRVVVNTYKMKGIDIETAIATMRLANMHQLVYNGAIIQSEWNNLELKLWEPPVEAGYSDRSDILIHQGNR